MRCSICRKEGHNKRTCLSRENKDKEKTKKKTKIKTEDTGLQFEKGICLSLQIDYNGKYKYGNDEPEKIASRLKNLSKYLNLPEPVHTAGKGGRYDFSSKVVETLHLSAKSSKKSMGKVAPQKIGQARPEKFCREIGINYTTKGELKKYIQNNIKYIIPFLVDNTFDCPNIYYNKHNDTIRLIKLNSSIDWNKYKFTWTCHWSKWNNSSTLKIDMNDDKIKKPPSLIEFQFHNTRKNMAIRWSYDNFLDIFKDKLDIIDF